MSDTRPEAQAIQDEIHRRMTGEQRIALALEMSLAVREIAWARLRAEHPDWTEWELKRETLRYAFGNAPLPPPLQYDVDIAAEDADCELDPMIG